MTINDKKVTFDMDDRNDNERFIKAYKSIATKITKAGLTEKDMEAFLKGCIKEKEITELLQDNKISTLTKVFTQFFGQVLDQWTVVANAYDEMAQSIVGMKNKSEELEKKYNEMTDHIGGE